MSGWEDSEGTWPERKGLLLNGFTYAAIVGRRRGTEEDGKFRQVSARQRLTWLLSDAEGFQPQPYEQLASVLREQGHEQDARKVQVAGQFRRRVLPDSSLLLWPIRFAWSLLLWATIGYGYKPWRIIYPIAILLWSGSRLFDQAYANEMIIRAKDLDPRVAFNSLRYTADLLVPGASIGDRARFIPIDGAATWAAIFTLAGWALAAMLIAGLTGVFKRQ